MLVYLLFIFTCGWCVCWLLFLNYQQHTRDGQLASLLRRRRQLKARRLRALRNEPPNDASLTVGAVNRQQGPDLEAARVVELPAADSQATIRRHQVDTIVDCNKQHSLLLLAPEECDKCSSGRVHSANCRLATHLGPADEDEPEAELDDEDLYGLIGDVDDYYCDCEEMGSIVNDHNHLSLMSYGDECGARAVDHFDGPGAVGPAHLGAPTNGGGGGESEGEGEIEMRGWPEDLIESDNDNEHSVNDDEDNDEMTLWPIVELHENPMNSVVCCNLARPNLKTATANEQRQWQRAIGLQAGVLTQNELELQPLELDDDPASKLDRSRLLSLRRDQNEHRAAIRLVSFTLSLSLARSFSSFTSYYSRIRSCQREGGTLAQFN